MSMPVQIKHLARIQTTWAFIKSAAKQQQLLLRPWQEAATN